MILKKLTIERFGKIKRFETAISDNTHIAIELEIAGHPYLITARGQPSQRRWLWDAADIESGTALDASLIFRNTVFSERSNVDDLAHYMYK